MPFQPTEIPDVMTFEPRVVSDARGFFLETYNEEAFAEMGLRERFVQDNQSHSKQGVLRGLHFRVERGQGKLVRVLRGKVWDVAVDLRKGSPTQGKWVGVELSSETNRMIWIPAGFAHGFYVVSEIADVLYKVTDFYSAAHERTLAWNDPTMGIRWPITTGPILSEKDKAGLSYAEAIR